jgi:hypothetical protein
MNSRRDPPIIEQPFKDPGPHKPHQFHGQIHAGVGIQFGLVLNDRRTLLNARAGEAKIVLVNGVDLALAAITLVHQISVLDLDACLDVS